MRGAPWLVAALLASCGEPANAVLEVRMHLPTRVNATSMEERRFAHIAVVPSDVDLDAPDAYADNAQVFDLMRPGCNVELSVVAPDPRADRRRLERGEEHGLALLVWFCPTEKPCAREDAPTWLIDFDKAFWVGERTVFEADVVNGTCSRWELAETTLPSVQRAEGGAEARSFELRVPACDVLGCLDETSTPAAEQGFCSLEGAHPCDE